MDKDYCVGIEINGFTLILSKISIKKRLLKIHKTLTVDARSKYFLHEKKALHDFLKNATSIGAVFSSEALQIIHPHQGKDASSYTETPGEIRTIRRPDSSESIHYMLLAEHFKPIYDLLRTFQLRIQILCPDTLALYQLFRFSSPEASQIICIFGRKSHLELSFFKESFWAERISLTEVKTKMMLEEVLLKHVTGVALDTRQLWSHCLLHQTDSCEHLSHALSAKLKQLCTLKLGTARIRGLKQPALDNHLTSIGAALLGSNICEHYPNFTLPEIYETFPRTHSQKSITHRILLCLTLCFLILGGIKYQHVVTLHQKSINLKQQIDLWNNTLEKHQHAREMLRYSHLLKQTSGIPLAVLTCLSTLFPNDFYIEALTEMSDFSAILKDHTPSVVIEVQGYCRPEIWNHKTYELIRQHPNVRALSLEKSKLLNTGALFFVLRLEWVILT